MPGDRRWVDDPRTTQELIEVALTELDLEDPEQGTGAVIALQERPTPEVLQRATVLTRSASPSERRLGIQILGELNEFAPGTPAMIDETMEVLLGLAETETDEDVLAEVARAFAYRQDPRGVDPLLGWLRSPVQRLRFFVAFGASTVYSPESADRIDAALLELAGDASDAIRDYARWSIRLLGLDTPAVRDVLVAGTSDPEIGVVAESLLGLALLREPRGLGPLRDFLRHAPVRAVNNYGLEAAAAWGDPSLLLALRGLDRTQPELSDEALEIALEACETGVPFIDD